MTIPLRFDDSADDDVRALRERAWREDEARVALDRLPEVANPRQVQHVNSRDSQGQQPEAVDVDIDLQAFAPLRASIACPGAARGAASQRAVIEKDHAGRHGDAGPPPESLRPRMRIVQGR